MFTFMLAQQYSALQEEECLYVQPIYTPLGYCRHVTLDVFWLKGKRRSVTSKPRFQNITDYYKRRFVFLFFVDPRSESA